jgi:HEAT repeat protein
MRRTLAFAVSLALLAAPAIQADDEPFWNSRPLGYWLNQLRVGTPAEREQAARGVGEMAVANGGNSVAAAVPLLVPCLDASVASVRAAAAEALGPIGEHAEPAGPRLLTLFEHDPDPGVRRSAGLSLSRLEPASPGLIDTAGRVLAGDADAGVRAVAGAALIEAGPAAAPVLSVARRSLDDPNGIVRVYAAALVARLSDDTRAVPLLLTSLRADDAAVRAESAMMLGDAGRLDPRTVPALIDALRDDDRQVRVAAADALGAIGHPAQEAITPLWRLIRDPDEDVREHSLQALKRIKES